jgi:hypothetical protein
MILHRQRLYADIKAKLAPSRPRQEILSRAILESRMKKGMQRREPVIT